MPKGPRARGLHAIWRALVASLGNPKAPFSAPFTVAHSPLKDAS